MAYRINFKKIKANEKIIDENGKRELYDLFHIIQLDEDHNNIIGVVKNDLCWNGTTSNGDVWTLEDKDIPFDYGDIIIYYKRTKKITLYNYAEDSSTESGYSDTESETSDSEIINSPAADV